MPKNKSIWYFARISLALLSICAVVAGVVAGVHMLTEKKIDENIESSIRKSVEEMFGEGVKYEVVKDFPSDIPKNVYLVDNEYYCVNLDSAGFGGGISMLVGLEKDGRLTGVKVVTHSESGPGAKAMDSKFLDLFKGKSDVKEVDSIAGATISSTAIKKGIETAQNILKEYLSGGGK